MPHRDTPARVNRDQVAARRAEIARPTVAPTPATLPAPTDPGKSPVLDRSSITSARTNITRIRAEKGLPQAAPGETLGTAPIPTETISTGAAPVVTAPPGPTGLPPIKKEAATTEAAPVQQDAFDKATADLEEVFAGKQGKVEEIVKAIQGLGDLRGSAFDNLFGEDSRISRFFAPSVKAVEEQILDTEGLLTNLRTDIVEGERDVGLTQGQFRRIEAKERGELVTQLDQLVRTQTRLKAGLDTQILLSEKEFESTLQGAQDNINSLIFQLEQEGIADQAEIDLIKRALEDELQKDSARASEDRQIAREIRQEEAQIEAEKRAVTEQERADAADAQKAREDAVRDILLSAQDFAIQAGVVPSENFQKVIEDVTRMAEEGKSLAEIQLAVLKAIGENPEVRAFINGEFSKAKGGGGGNATADKPEAPEDTGPSESQKVLDRITSLLSGGQVPGSGGGQTDFGSLKADIQSQ